MSSCKCKMCNTSEYNNLSKLIQAKEARIDKFISMLCRIQEGFELDAEDSNYKYYNLKYIIDNLQSQVKNLYNDRKELIKQDMSEVDDLALQYLQNTRTEPFFKPISTTTEYETRIANVITLPSGYVVDISTHPKELTDSKSFKHLQIMSDRLKASIPSYKSLVANSNSAFPPGSVVQIPRPLDAPTLNDPFAPFRYALSESNLMEDGCPSEIDVADTNINYYNYSSGNGNMPADPNTFAGGLRLKAKCWCCQKDITPIHTKMYIEDKIRVVFNCHGKTETKDFTEVEMIEINKDGGFWQPFLL